MGLKNRDFSVTFANSSGPCTRLGDHLVSRYNIVGSHVVPIRPSLWCLLAPNGTVWGPIALWWAKIWCLVVATLCRYGPWSKANFFFNVDSLTKVGGSRLNFQDHPPLWGPTVEDSTILGQRGVVKNPNFWLTCTNPGDPCAKVGLSPAHKR